MLGVMGVGGGAEEPDDLPVKGPAEERAGVRASDSVSVSEPDMLSSQLSASGAWTDFLGFEVGLRESVLRVDETSAEEKDQWVMSGEDEVVCGTWIEVCLTM